MGKRDFGKSGYVTFYLEAPQGKIKKTEESKREIQSKKRKGWTVIDAKKSTSTRERS